MKTIKIKKITFILSIFFASITFQAYAFAADVDVYGEGVINETELKVYLYVDVNVDNLVSYGVSLNYDSTELSVVQVEKDPEPIPYTANENRWYLGESTAAYRNNPTPDSSIGKIIIIGGKKDPASPSLLISYALGDGSDVYKNFVHIDDNVPQILDGDNVLFGIVKVVQQGDANGDGDITPRDINCVKAKLL